MKAKRIDWVAAKIEYVNNPALRYEDIAQKYGTTEGTVRVRSHRESWTEARDARANLLQRNVTRKSMNAAAIELAKWNEQDLVVAKMGRILAGKQLKAANESTTPIAPKDLRMLMGALESAQRIARLALGASTTNISDQTLDPLIGEINVEDLSDDQLISFQQSYQQLLAQTFGNGRNGAAQASGPQVQ